MSKVINTSMTNKSIEEIYQKKDLHQHILDRPDSYIGSTKATSEDQWVVDGDGDNLKIVKKTIEYNPGLMKIFDEILVNAIDHTVRDKTTTVIKVDIDPERGSISVFNDGTGIPVVKHEQYDIWIPELIFGNLLTSSNYDDTQQRVVGGVNGYGAKACNIFSKEFIVETIDSKNKKKYKQTFKDNMYVKDEPEVKTSNSKPYTKITFIPDLKRFKLKKLSQDVISLMKRRVYDCIVCTSKKVSVYLDGKKLKEKSFLSYTSLYSENDFAATESEDKDFVWNVSAGLSDNYEQVSFVNGVSTTKGGKHVDYILNQIVKKLAALIEKNKKIKNIKNSYIKDRLFLFVRATIVNPSFDNQSKNTLTTPVKEFGTSFEISDAFIKKLYKSGIVEEVISFVEYKNNKDLQKTSDNKKKSSINVKNLDDAAHAGTSKSSECTLILTEGLSAKTFAVSGLSVIGRAKYGIFPLKGKVLNVREATQSQILNNKEINDIKKILGLRHGEKYESISSLRYGSVMILCDSDVDGSHITGLIMNMFHTWWPKLLERKGFIVSMKTPLIKTVKGKNEHEFYTVSDYNVWKNKQADISKWNVKYYKGLGTSKPEEAKAIFRSMDKNTVKYISSDKNITNNAMLLAFEKKKANDRKHWLSEYNPEYTLDQTLSDIEFEDFVNKSLIQFSIADITRSIPSLCDGLKPSQRKVLYAMFKKNYKKEIKVAQFGSDVAGVTAYHHGEVSLYSTIIGMAQDYVGSNNVNLLKPNGQFGCLDPDTRVLTWDGDEVKASSIHRGSTLVGDDGEPRTVLRTTSGKDEMYEVKLDNGETFKVNSEHILTFYVPLHKTTRWDPYTRSWIALIFDNENMVYRKIIHGTMGDDDTPWSSKSTAIEVLCDFIKDIDDSLYFDIKVKDYIGATDEIKETLFAVKNHSPIKWPRKELPFHVSKILLSLEERTITRIPIDFIVNSVNVRYYLLSGIFNKIYTDNIIEHGECSLVINKEIINIYGGELYDDVKFTCHSLGIIVTETDYSIEFIGTNIRYLLINKKISKVKRNGVKKFKISVKNIGVGYFVGWEVDKNERFLLADFTVTHNSRLSNGKDASSPRYIFTEMSDITDKLFNSDDFPVLKYLEDDGVSIEPEYYVPVLPLILINGCHGIGTGYSTSIPCYNPKDIIYNMNCLLKNKPCKEMKPWYKGFQGKIVKTKDKSYDLYGVVKNSSGKTLEITELPVGVSTDDYRDFINDFVNTNDLGITKVINDSNDKDIKFILNFATHSHKSEFLNNGEDTHKILKLVKPLNETNMHLFNHEGKIVKYDSPLDILKEFLEVRLKYNTKRKRYLIEKHTTDLSVLSNKIRFIEAIISGDLVVYRRPKKEIIDDLKKSKYKQVNGSYDYLISIPIYSFTSEKIDELTTKHSNVELVLSEIENKTEEMILEEDILSLGLQ